MLSKNNRFISWLLCGLLCFSNSFSVINAEEEIIPENEPEVQEITVEDNQETEEEQENTENNEELPEETPDISEEQTPEESGDSEEFPASTTEPAEVVEEGEITEEPVAEPTNEPELEQEDVAEELQIEEDENEEATVLYDNESNGFKYRVENGEAVLTGYYTFGWDGVLDIPSELDGYLVTSIDGSAFYTNSKITSVTIPGSVKSIGELAFGKCTKLTNVKISNGVTHIGDSAFSSCVNLPDITIPNSVTSIGDGAFGSCESFTSLTIPNSVTSIGVGIVSGCVNITSINVDGDNAVYDSRNDCNAIIETTTKTLIAGCSNTVIPDDITSIGVRAFRTCKNLTGIKIPDSVTSIGNEAFYNCRNLTSIKIPNNVTSVGDSAFYNCTNLKTVTLGKNITYIGNYSFEGCSFSSIDIPNSVASIEYGAFRYNENLVGIKIPDKVRVIDSNVFEGCSKLKKVILGKEVLSIESSAFKDCTSLTSITIHDLVKNIEVSAFSGCDSLTDVYYTGTEEQWNLISIMGYNDSLLNANFHYNYVPSTKLDVHSDDKEEIANEVASTLAASIDVPNVTIDVGDLKGPQIQIGDYKINLFELADTKIEIPIKKAYVQISVDTEKKKICGVIGCKKFEGGATVIGDPNSFSGTTDKNFWEAYTEAKDLYKMISGANPANATLAKAFKKQYDVLESTKTDMLVNAEVRFFGYLEFSYETGTLQWSEGGCSFELNLSQQFNNRLPSCPVFYGTVKLESDTKAKLRFIIEKDQLSDVVFDVNEELKADLGFGAGDNTGKFQAYVEGGFTGSINALLSSKKKDNHNVFIDMTGDLYWEYRVKSTTYILPGNFNYGDRKKYPLYKLELYPEQKTLPTDSGAKTMADFFEEAEQITRLYSYDPMIMTVNNNYIPEEAVYPYPEQKLINLESGKMLMVWVGDTGEKPENERTSIMYSVFSDGTWSEPAVIHENNTYNDHPMLCQNGNKVFLVWMRSNSTYNADWSELECLEHLELVYSEFVEDTQTWSEPFVVSDQNNTFAETDYDIASYLDKTVVAWVENSENDLMMNEGLNRLYVRTNSNGTWGEIQNICSTTEQISYVTVKQSFSRYEVYYQTYDPSSVQTTSYVYKQSSGKAEVIDNGDHFSIADGDVFTLKDSEIYCNGESIGLTGVSNFSVVENDNRSAVLAVVPTGFTSEIYVSYYEYGSWSEWTQLTGYNKHIRNYSAVFNEYDQLVVALTLVDVNPDADTVFGDAHMVVVSDLHYNDLVVDENLYYSGTVKAGEETEFFFDVTNISEETLYGVNINIDGFGNSVTKTIYCEIPAGESDTLSFVYQVPDDLTHGTIAINAVPSYQREENNEANNYASTEIGFADLSIEASSPELKNDKWVIPVKVVNQGYSTSSLSTVTVYGGNAYGEILDTIEINSLAAGEESNFDYEIPERYRYTATDETMISLQFEVVTDTEEASYANNSDREVFDSLTDHQDSITLIGHNVNLIKGENITLEVAYDYGDETKEKSVEWSSSDTSVATVVNGIVTAENAGTAIITAETTEGLTTECVVTVTIPATGLSLSSESETIEYGTGKQLYAVVTPEDASNKNVTWYSSDPSVVSVDENGYITATGKGIAYIEAATEDGGYSAICEIRSTKTVYAEGIHIPSNVKKISVGRSVQLRAEFTPADTTNQKVYWTSSNPDIAKVDSFGKVTALSEGTVTITATSEDGGFSDRNVIEIRYVHLDSIAFKNEKIDIRKNDTIKLNVTLIPDDASNRKITFTSDNEEVVKVTEEGVITGISEGTAIITVTAEDGNKTASCTVVVLAEEAQPGIYIKGLESSYAYTGTAIKPQISVYDAGTLLTNKTDYTITYKNTTKAYTVADPENPTAADKKSAPQIIIKSNSKGNYKGSKTVYFTIEPLDINDEQITVDELSVQETGKLLSPVPTVYFNGKKLKNKTDYIVDYSGWNRLTGDENNEAEITIIAKEKGNFSGERKVTVYVAPKGTTVPLSKLKVSVSALKYEDLTEENFIEKVEKAITVKDGKTQLFNGINYIIKDIKPEDRAVGSFKVTLEGDGYAYIGERTVTVKITGIALTDKKIKAAVPSYTYTGEPLTLGNDFSIKYIEELLEEGKDYTVESYSNNINAGTATVVLKGLGRFTGTRKVTFKITPDTTADTRIVIVDPAKYCKGGSKPKISIEGLTEGIDYTVKYSNNTKADTFGTALITYKGNYKGTKPVPITFYIEPKDISDITITSKDKVYSAKANAWKSAPVLKDTDGKKLKAGTDYEKEISYTAEDGSPLTEPVPAGTVVKVTVTGKGNYTGAVSTTYRILETGKDISKATFKITQKEYTGSPVILTESDITATINKTTPLKLGTDFVIDGYTNNLKKGTAKVTFRGINGYGGTKTVSFKIGQRSIVDYWKGINDFFARMF